MIPLGHQTPRVKTPSLSMLQHQHHHRQLSMSVDLPTTSTATRTVRFSEQVTSVSSTPALIATTSPLANCDTASNCSNNSNRQLALIGTPTNNSLIPVASNDCIAKMAAEAEAAAKPPQPKQITIAPGTDLTTVKTIDDTVLFGGQASFGLVYEHNLYERIHRYMDIMAIDDICYYGDARSSIPASLEKKFALFKPITFVSFPPTADQVIAGEHIPAPQGQGDYRISSPIQLYFQMLSRNEAHQFQHIIINWSEVCSPGLSIADLERLFYHVKKSLTDTGKVLCLVRPGDATTLPLFADGIEFLRNTECPTARAVLSAMHTAGFNVHWAIDILPAVIPVRKWLSMIRNCVPAQLSLMDRHELNRGVTELSEGMFRYQPNLVEFSDRLLFVIGAAATAPSTAVIQRLAANPMQTSGYDIGASGLINFGPKSTTAAKVLSYPSTIPKEAIYEMAIDDTIKPYVEARLKAMQKKKKLDKREYGFF